MAVVIFFILRAGVAGMHRSQRRLRTGRIGVQFDGVVPDWPMLLTVELGSEANFCHPGLVGGVWGGVDGRNT